MAKNKKISKKSIIGMIVGALLSVIGIVVTVLTGCKRKRKKDANQYKPI